MPPEGMRSGPAACSRCAVLTSAVAAEQWTCEVDPTPHQGKFLTNYPNWATSRDGFTFAKFEDAVKKCISLTTVHRAALRCEAWRAASRANGSNAAVSPRRATECTCAGRARSCSRPRPRRRRSSSDAVSSAAHAHPSGLSTAPTGPPGAPKNAPVPLRSSNRLVGICSGRLWWLTRGWQRAGMDKLRLEMERLNVRASRVAPGRGLTAFDNARSKR
jgi:hypothetical protein